MPIEEVTITPLVNREIMSRLPFSHSRRVGEFNEEFCFSLVSMFPSGKGATELYLTSHIKVVSNITKLNQAVDRCQEKEL